MLSTLPILDNFNIIHDGHGVSTWLKCKQCWKTGYTKAWAKSHSRVCVTKQSMNNQPGITLCIDHRKSSANHLYTYPECHVCSSSIIVMPKAQLHSEFNYLCLACGDEGTSEKSASDHMIFCLGPASYKKISNRCRYAVTRRQFKNTHGSMCTLWKL